MIKKFIVSFCVLISVSAFAQRGSSSAYSFYGVGETKFKGTTENRSMGGLSIFPDSTHVNLQNPAGYGGLKLTTFTLSGSYNTLKSDSEVGSDASKNTSVDYLSIGVPLTEKWGAGIGLMSYTSVGYKIQNISTSTESISSSSLYEGDGGINRVFFNTGYKVTPSFSVGASMEYNFGTIETSSVRFLESVQYGARELNTSIVSGLSFNIGGMWEKKMSNSKKLFISAYYTPESNLNLDNSRVISTIQYYSSVDAVVIDEQNIAVADTKLKLPSKLAFGAGFGEERKWLLGAELTLTNSSSLENRFEDITNASFQNSKKVSVGGYYIPEYNSFSSYFKRITFRGGLRFEETGLIVNDKEINDAAVTLGLGFPVTGSFSNFNVGLEYGSRGTKSADLVRENYFNVTFSASLNDKWFVKRKIQ